MTFRYRITSPNTRDGQTERAQCRRVAQ